MSALRQAERRTASYFSALPYHDWRDDNDHHAANRWAFRHAAGIQSIDDRVAFLVEWRLYDDQMRRIEAIARDMIEAAKGAA